MRHGLICVVLAACSFNPDFNGTLYACDPDGACPDRHVCVNQRCVPTAPEASACALAVAAGEAHTCAIRTDGTAWCWGGNSLGQLGHGDTTDQTSPVQVVAPAKQLPRFTAITGGKTHSCALGADHTVWCWGGNAAGQLGNASIADSRAPVLVRDVTDAREVVAGDSHTCARLGDGSLTCWGANVSGQLGDGATKSSNAPVSVQIASRVAAVAAGGDTTCAVDDQHALWCWGANTAGQFGDETTQTPQAPTQVPTPDAVTQVAVGQDFSCALAGGAVWCAGQNKKRQLGDPLVSTDPSFKRVMAALPNPAVAIAAGAHFACATDDQARVWCWGQDDNNQLADSIGADHADPALTTYQHISDLAGGSGHLCGRSATGGITCSGDNARGQIGNGHRTTQPKPGMVSELTDVMKIEGGGAEICATRTDKTVWCWGANDSGQIGDGLRIDRTRPTRVESVANATAAVVGGSHACALLEDSTAVCWGANDSGQLGGGTTETHGLAGAVVVNAATGAKLTGIMRLAAGGSYTCALADSGVHCWGESVTTPTLVMALPPAIHAITVGSGHACGINSDGTVECWGSNTVEQHGIGTTTPSPPSTVMVLKNADQISAHRNFTCAHVMDGSVWCWGSVQDGGFGNTGRRTDPPGNQNVNGTTKVVTAETHICALQNDATITCWGQNVFGQLGDGTYVTRSMPEQISGLDHVSDLAGADGSTCALRDDGTVWCWGDDRHGQLGDGVSAEQAPVAPLLVCP